MSLHEKEMRAVYTDTLIELIKKKIIMSGIVGLQQKFRETNNNIRQVNSSL